MTFPQCYTFNNPDNVEDIKKTLKGGVDNGLELLLDIQQEEYMPMWKESGEIENFIKVTWGQIVIY